MAVNTVEAKILLRCDTTANWTASTRVLLKGEMGVEFTDGVPKLKVGNGVDTWANLDYITTTYTEIEEMISNAVLQASHTHDNKDILDAIEVALTEELKDNYDAAYIHATSEHAPVNAQENVIEVVMVNGAELDVSNKSVNIEIPTKVSELTNDAGYLTEYTDTTYALGASTSATNGNVKMNLVGSDDTTTSVSIKGSGGTTVTSDSTGAITVSSDEYEHPLSGVTSGSYTKVVVNEYGHVTDGSNPTTLAGYGIEDAVAENEIFDENGVILSSVLPSFVDDVVEGYLSGSTFYSDSACTEALVGESSKIYVDLNDLKTYRWSGSTYVEISSSLALGTTSSTAFPGDLGEIAYEHSQSAHAPADAEANQYAWSAVAVGTTTVSADTTTDTLTLVAGDNVTLTADATNDKITISATDTDTQYTAGTGLSMSGTTINHSNSIEAGTAQGSETQTLDFGDTFEIPSVTYDEQGHITDTGTTVLTLPKKPASSTNADTATALKTARAIDGVLFDGTANVNHYGECTTAASTVTKAVTISNFTLVNGARAIVKFTKTNTASSPLLNVNSTGAKSILYLSEPIEAGYLAADYIYEFVYNATDDVYELIGDINTDSDTANTLATARNFSITGGATALGVSFDGSEDVALDVTSLDTMYLVVNDGDTLIIDGNSTGTGSGGSGSDSGSSSSSGSTVAYTGGSTTTATTTVSGTTISTTVKVSSTSGNALSAASDGLYVSISEISSADIHSLFA